MLDKNLKNIIDRYLAGSCSPEEKILVESWYLSQISNEELPTPENALAKSEIWRKIVAKKSSRKKVVQLIRWAAAAIVIIATGTSLHLYQVIKKPIQHANTTHEKIKPGREKATLSLADGTVISLDDSSSKFVGKHKNLEIRQHGGKLIYSAFYTSRASSPAGQAPYNTITTPNGGEFEVILSDGSKVWLNAGSSLRFPRLFSGTERTVELHGEGYFEVAHNKTKPFKVITKGQIVEVLGTHFNINSYDDEPLVTTTLLEGSVKISNDNNINMVLVPGDQAVVKNGQITISKVNTVQAIAWKNGNFTFENMTLKAIMRQISRWYDVKVSYQGSIGDTRFGGSISRNKSITEVLDVLALTQGVKFTITGRKVIVRP